VITNDDLPAHKEAAAITTEANDSSAPEDESSKAAPGKKDATAKEGEDKAKPEKDKAQAKKEEKKDPQQLREEKERETQKRSEEINKRYTDRIEALHQQINAAQIQLTKLQTQQVDNTNSFKRTAGMSPTLNEYEAQQRSFDEQIAAQRELITSLNSQLEDAREAARHAGVPHALDY
jgi:hypothetical protein